MKELAQATPDVKVLLALEPEELGSKLLFLLRKRVPGMFSLANLDSEFWDGPHFAKRTISLPARAARCDNSRNDRSVGLAGGARPSCSFS